MGRSQQSPTFSSEASATAPPPGPLGPDSLDPTPCTRMRSCSSRGLRVPRWKARLQPGFLRVKQSSPRPGRAATKIPCFSPRPATPGGRFQASGFPEPTAIQPYTPHRGGTPPQFIRKASLSPGAPGLASTPGSPLGLLLAPGSAQAECVQGEGWVPLCPSGKHSLTGQAAQRP